MPIFISHNPLGAAAGVAQNISGFNTGRIIQQDQIQQDQIAYQRAMAQKEWDYNTARQAQQDQLQRQQADQEMQARAQQMAQQQQQFAYGVDDRNREMYQQDQLMRQQRRGGVGDGWGPIQAQVADAYRYQQAQDLAGQRQDWLAQQQQQKYDLEMAKQQAMNYRTNQQGEYGLQREDTRGQYGLQNTDLRGQYGLQNTDLRGQYGLQQTGMQQQGANQRNDANIQSRQQIAQDQQQLAWDIAQLRAESQAAILKAKQAAQAAKDARDAAAQGRMSDQQARLAHDNYQQAQGQFYRAAMDAKGKEISRLAAALGMRPNDAQTQSQITQAQQELQAIQNEYRSTLAPATQPSTQPSFSSAPAASGVASTPPAVSSPPPPPQGPDVGSAMKVIQQGPDGSPTMIMNSRGVVFQRAGTDFATGETLWQEVTQ